MRECTARNPLIDMSIKNQEHETAWYNINKEKEKQNSGQAM